MFAASPALLMEAARKRRKALGEFRRLLFSLERRELGRSQSSGLLLFALKLWNRSAARVCFAAKGQKQTSKEA